MQRRDGARRAPGTGISNRTAGLVLGTVLVVCALVVVTAQSGLPKQLIENRRGTRWLVYEPMGRAILADAVTGRVVLQLDAVEPLRDLVALQGEAGAYLIDRTAGQAITIDEKNVRLDTGRPVQSLVSETGELITGVGVDGAVAVSPSEGSGVLVPPTGAVRPLLLPERSRVTEVAADGSVWTIDESLTVTRQLGVTADEYSLDDGTTNGSGNVDITSVGDEAVVLDRDRGTIRWLPGEATVQLPAGPTGVDAILQQPGVDAPCVWVGRVDQLLCVGRDGVDESVQLDSVTVDRNDRLAVTDGGALLLRGSGQVVHIRLTSGSTETVPFSWESDDRQLAADETGVWLDDPAGKVALVVTSAGLKKITKVDDSAPVFDVDGKPVISDRADRETDGEGGQGEASEFEAGPIQPDDDGIAEPPVARPDSASARQGVEVPVVATANDFDPDGQAVVIESVTQPTRGRASILNGSTVVFTPESSFVGTETFSYTIEDPDGMTDSADVTIEMISADASNRPPVARPDRASTASGRPVVVDVLRNDVDPERTQLSVKSITPPPAAEGRVERVVLTDGRVALKFIPSPAFQGTSVFSYVAADGDDGQSSPADVAVTVGPPGAPNNPPVAVDDAVRTRPEQSTSIPVLANDTDADNDTLAIEQAEVEGRDGQVVIDGQNLLFVARPTAARTVLINYTVTDGQDTDDGVVFVRVLPASDENQPPVTFPDQVSTVGPTIFDPTKNDHDPDGDRLSLVEVGQPAEGGSAQVLSGNRVSFTPATGTTGTVRFPYTISDGHGHEAVGEIAVIVNATRLPDAPHATDDVAETTTGNPVTIDVLANDTDPSGDQLVLDGRPSCQYGSCAVNSDQTITFTPPANQTSTFRFTYRVRNTVGATATATVIVQVREPSVVNRPPIAIEDVADAERGRATTIDVLANDRDEDPATLVLKSVGSTPAGDVARAGRAIRFTPNATGPATASFQYEVEDAQGLTATGKVTVTIRSVSSDPPTAVDDRASMVLGGVPPEVDVLANDSTENGTNDSLRLSGNPVLEAGSSGRVDRVGSRTLRITPPAGFVGDIRARYEIEDTAGLRASGTFVLTVTAPPNQPPIARDDSRSTNANTPVSIPVLANDDDPDGDPLTVEITSPPANGQGAATAPDGRSIRFVPAPDFSGTATFSYVAVDASGRRSNPAVVTVHVVACAQALPIAPDLLNEFTPFNTPHALSLLAPSQLDFQLDVFDVVNGSVTATGGGRVVFTPSAGLNGSGSFRYRVTNSCATARTGRVEIDVNQVPRFIGGTFQVVQGQPLSLGVSSFAADHEALTITSATPSSVAGGVGTGALTFQSSTLGPVALTVVVADPGGLSASGTVVIDVIAAPNTPPTAERQDWTITPGGPVMVQVLDRVSDDGPTSALRVEIVRSEAVLSNNGQISARIADDGQTVLVTSTPNANGIGTLTYRVRDDANQPSNIAELVIKVNNRPNATNDVITVAPGSSGAFTVTAVDPDGNPVTLGNVVSNSPSVAATKSGDLTISYSVAPDATGTVTITYRLTDSLSSSTDGTLTLTIT